MDNSVSYLVVSVGNDKWAIPGAQIEEIVPVYYFYEPENGVPDYVIGIINYRGELIKLVDTKKFLLGERAVPAAMNKIVIIKKENLKFALLVNDAEDIVRAERAPYFEHAGYTYRVVDTERIVF